MNPKFSLNLKYEFLVPFTTKKSVKEQQQPQRFFGNDRKQIIAEL